MKRRGLLVGVIVVIAVGSLGAVQQAPAKPQAPNPSTYWSDQKNTLKDLKVLHVYVPDIPELAGQLDAATLKTNAELRLRQTGITVITFDTKNGAFEPDLDVLVDVLKGTDAQARLFVYDVRVRLQREVDVLRTQSEVLTFFTVHPVMMATVWESREVLGYVGESHIDTIRQVVDDEVSAFLNDWLEMNPKKW